MSLSIIVTGAAGFIGSHTVEGLLAGGHRVIGVDNFRTGKLANLEKVLPHPAFILRELDVAAETDFIDLTTAMRPDVIVHLAALVSVPESIANPELNVRLNLEATKVVCEAARRGQTRRVIFASSAAVYGNPASCPIDEHAATVPLSPYGAAKLASERLLLDAAARGDFVARCQRYFNVFGPRQDPKSGYSGVISIFIDHLEQGTRPTIFGDGQQTRDFVFVADVARANVIAATKPDLPSGCANICTGNPTTLNELWTLVSRFRVAMPALHAHERLGDIRHSLGRPDRAAQELGFRAQIGLKDGLAVTLRDHLEPATAVLSPPANACAMPSG